LKHYAAETDSEISLLPVLLLLLLILCLYAFDVPVLKYVRYFHFYFSQVSVNPIQ
jgi:hypothetical protein